MRLTYLMFGVALCLSTIAAFYSIVGLAAIFAAASWPIIVMGSILEIAKLVVTVWLHEYWPMVKRTMKLYLVPAVFILMLITSMGIFGFLSKAHLDQAVPTGDVAAKVQILDEKIKTERDNIDVARKALRQMDEAVDQTMARSNDEKGADKASALRRSQQRERTNLQNEIAASQKKIAAFNEERAPIASELRKVEAEVGPIKYIAALIYGDNPDANLLEKAVRWVIIILVLVFDPLAVMMLLAATESMKWEKDKLKEVAHASNDNTNVRDEDIATSDDRDMDRQPELDDATVDESSGTTVEDHVLEKVTETVDATEEQESKKKKLWKELHPDEQLKDYKKMLEKGKISDLPWNQLGLEADDVHTNIAFGTKWPAQAVKGDMFLRVDYLPTKLFKWNGGKWIEVDKGLSNSYTYDTAYIDYLIDQIAKGEYDTELLNEAEKEQIQSRLNETSTGQG